MEEEEKEDVDDDAGAGTAALIEVGGGCGGTVCVSERFLLITRTTKEENFGNEGEEQGNERGPCTCTP
jgi:hypothetical protein